MDTTILATDELAERVRSVAESENNNNKDEVWDGVYIVSPGPSNEHQVIIGGLTAIFQVAIGWTGAGLVQPGANVSDREDQWEHNYRCPDVVVYLNGTTARNLGTHWVGGPDFAVEVVSLNDRSRQKFDFYAKINTRELLVVDRDPWILELYRLQDGVLGLVGKSSLDRPDLLTSQVLPLTFRLVVGDPRPRIEVVHSDGVQHWSV
jgi:Uma2 family endonuclease